MGATLGAVFAAGVLLVGFRIRTIRRPQLAIRVLPYVRDLPQVGVAPVPSDGIVGPMVRAAADTVERVLGGATSVRRRLERANIDKTVNAAEKVLMQIA